MRKRPARAAATLRALLYKRQSRDKRTSIEDQDRLGRAACGAHDWALIEVIEDGTSASDYARKARKGYPGVVVAIREGLVDVLILWEVSRADRRLTSFSALLDLCREHGVKIYVLKHARQYDPADARDWESLATDGVKAQAYSANLSLDVARGLEGQAMSGRPHSQTTYGYRRRYDPDTREFVDQVEHPEHAPIVREIVRRVGNGDPLRTISTDLTARGVPTPQLAPRWSATTVRNIANAPAYIGVRVHRPLTGGRTEHAAVWPRLVTDAEHYAARRVLSAPERQKSVGIRPGKAITLLGWLAACGACGQPARTANWRGQRYYRCHGYVRIDQLDELVTEVIIARLSDPAVYGRLRHATDGDDRTAVEALALADQLTAELADWRDSAARGETTRASLAVVEAGLAGRIADARASAQRASVPPSLRALLGPGQDVRARWHAAPLAARRDVVRSLLTVGIHGRHGRGPEITDRVELTWRT